MSRHDEPHWSGCSCADCAPYATVPSQPIPPIKKPLTYTASQLRHMAQIWEDITRPGNPVSSSHRTMPPEVFRGAAAEIDRLHIELYEVQHDNEVLADLADERGELARQLAELAMHYRQQRDACEARTPAMHVDASLLARVEDARRLFVVTRSPVYAELMRDVLTALQGGTNDTGA